MAQSILIIMLCDQLYTDLVGNSTSRHTHLSSGFTWNTLFEFQIRNKAQFAYFSLICINLRIIGGKKTYSLFRYGTRSEYSRVIFCPDPKDGTLSMSSLQIQRTLQKAWSVTKFSLFLAENESEPLAPEANALTTELPRNPSTTFPALFINLGRE